MFRPRLADYMFLWREVLRLDRLAELTAYPHATSETIEAVLEEAGRFCVDVLAPLDRPADEEGARLVDGGVVAPLGFRAAYTAFVDGGWPSLQGSERDGGQGLPAVLNFALYEMLSACCMSFVHYTALTHGAALLLEQHADETLRRRYVPNLVTGRWGGTMCLTEAQAGSDLGLIRTIAIPNPDGSYAVSGTKIFISAGDHDLTENIVHLVLARLPDAPPGVRGISLLLVPKFVPDDDGSLGDRNGVECTGLEHKMGIRGAATCVMTFEGARGWLVGPPHRGLQAMFTMMNAERLLLSAQGQGIAEASYQNAVAYARDRLQGRGQRDGSTDAEPIIEHADVRRMLMTMRVHAEGARALGLWVMSELDRSTHASEETQRVSAAALVAFMTPVVKVMLSDMGVEAAQLGVQVMGGHGYIREWGMEQRVRDVRILQLYEGANGIQALDLVLRKLPLEDGRIADRLTDLADRSIATACANQETQPFAERLQRALSNFRVATGRMLQADNRDLDSLGAASTPYLNLAGHLALGVMWLQMAVAALTTDDRSFAAAKLASARFFFEQILPRTAAYAEMLEAGQEAVMGMAIDAF